MLTKYTAIFSDKALMELDNAVDWYDLQSFGLGEKFLNAIEKVLVSIERNPYFASIQYDEVRVAYCKKFPYGIHYEIN